MSGYSGGAGAMDSSDNDVSEANGYSEQEVREAGSSEAGGSGSSGDSGGSVVESVFDAVDSFFGAIFGGSNKWKPFIPHDMMSWGITILMINNMRHLQFKMHCDTCYKSFCVTVGAVIPRECQHCKSTNFHVKSWGYDPTEAWVKEESKLDK